MKVRYRSEGGDRLIQAEGKSTGLPVFALAFYEGSHTDSEGREETYSRDDIVSLVIESNNQLAQGTRILLFKDHYPDTDSTIGKVLNFDFKEITKDMLPHEGMVDLVGKMGAFAEAVILGKENIDRYKDSRIKSISVGLDNARTFFEEISVVPFPALSGASLFKKHIGDQTMPLGEMLNGMIAAVTTEERPRAAVIQAMATFAGIEPETVNQILIEEMTCPPMERLEGFAEALGGDVETLRAEAEADGCTYTTPEEGDESDAMESETEMMKDKEKQNYSAYQQKIAALEKRVYEAEQRQKQTEREAKATAKFHSLRCKGDALRSGGKLTPAEHEFLFGDGHSTQSKFSKAELPELGKIEFHLEMVEKYANPVQFGRFQDLSTHQDIGDRPGAIEDDEQEIKAAAERLAKKKINYGGR